MWQLSKAVLQLFPPNALLRGIPGSEPSCSLIKSILVVESPNRNKNQTESPELLWSTVFTLGNPAAWTLSTQCIFWNSVKIHVVSLGDVAHPTAAWPKHSSHTGLWKQHCRSGSAGCWQHGQVLYQNHLIPCL